MHTFNLKHCKYCCICKYWYDPTNSAIAPVAPNINMWGVATDMYNDRKKCIKANLPKSAVDSCSRFECKLPVIWKVLDARLSLVCVLYIFTRWSYVPGQAN